jgi:hypothetical protein
MSERVFGLCKAAGFRKASRTEREFSALRKAREFSVVSLLSVV